MAGRIVTIKRFTGISAANAVGTASTDGLHKYRFLYSTVKYSAAPTQTGVTTTLDSGVGAAYDVVLNTGSSDAQTTVYIPTPDTLIILPGDVITVSAPAGGGVITSQITIYCEVLH